MKMRGEEKQSFDIKRFAVSAVIGGAVGVLMALLLLLGAAALVLKGVLGEGTAAAYAAAFVGSVAGGFIAAKHSRAGALICAAAVAVVMLAVSLLAGLAMFESFAFTSGAAALIPAVLIGGLVGSFLGSGRDKKRTKKK